MKRLDTQLAHIRHGAYQPGDFIIADAKDGDMAFGIGTPGPLRDAQGRPAAGRSASMHTYRADMRRVLASDLVDILLMSLSSAETLADEGLFAASAVTPAVRLNDASDIWAGRGNRYQGEPAATFRTARLDRARAVADLGLYAITFYNDLARDRATLEAYARFRDEASALGMRHFLEVFNPQTSTGMDADEFAAFNNDCIVRCLAGVSRHDAPLFLKAAYNGPRATEEIAGYDPGRIVFGILGGAAGTTRDCLELLKQAEKYGARVALFGRKIYQSEDSVLMLQAMRRVLGEGISSLEGVRAYHADLAAAGKPAWRGLDDDMQLTDPLLRAHLA
ncbi:MAG: hypothetical protein RIQ60_463 [Pseudomonadota bacterium]|jgi:DhnA family fructose-bisphosphate aldolase class Ia